MKKIILPFVAFAAPLLAVGTAFAQDAEASMWNPVGKGLAIGIAAAGCGMGQGRAAAAALEGIARNPNASGKIFTPLIIGLAFIESLALYAWITTFTI